jgi:hypothetical protein
MMVGRRRRRQCETRHANLARVPGEDVKVFLIGNAASWAKSGEKVPAGYWRLDLMPGRMGRGGGQMSSGGKAPAPLATKRRMRMRSKQRSLMLAVGAIAAISVASALAQGAHEHAMESAASPPGDSRQLVNFPEPMRQHTLANMRDHLSTLQKIASNLARADYEGAAQVAEQRLGLSSLEAHGAAHLAPYMPQRMQDIGTAMHRAASRFATTAQDAGASGDVRPALAVLAEVIGQCVACHAAYRMH